MPGAGILDTSAVIDLSDIDDDLLPSEAAITAVTLAELAAGPHAAADAIQRSIRQERLQVGRGDLRRSPVRRCGGA